MCDSFASVTQIVLAMFHLVFASSPKAKWELQGSELKIINFCLSITGDESLSGTELKHFTTHQRQSFAFKQLDEWISLYENPFSAAGF